MAQGPVSARVLTTDWAWRAGARLPTADGDGLFRGFIHERLAGLLERRGDRTGAAEQYRALVELWAGADPALQPQIEAARAALARLGGEPGPR